MDKVEKEICPPEAPNLPTFLCHYGASLSAEDLNRLKLKLLFLLKLFEQKKVPPFSVEELLIVRPSLTPLIDFFSSVSGLDPEIEFQRLKQLLLENKLFFVKPAIIPYTTEEQQKLINSFDRFIEQKLTSYRCVKKVYLIGSKSPVSGGRYKVPFVHYNWCKLATGYNLFIEIDPEYEEDLPKEWDFRFTWDIHDCSYYHLIDLGNTSLAPVVKEFPGVPFFEHPIEASLFFHSRGNVQRKDQWLEQLPRELLFDRTAKGKKSSLRKLSSNIDSSEKIFYPRTLGVRLTYRCNSKCRHCYCYSPKDEMKKEQLNFEVIRRLIDEAKECGLTGIGISGGEPFILRDLLFSIVEYGKKNGFNINIATNAFWAQKPLTAKRYLNKLKKLGFSPPGDSIVASGGQFHMEHIDKASTRNLIKLYTELFNVPFRRLDFEYVKGEEQVLKDYIEYLEKSGIDKNNYNLVERTMFQSIGHSRSLDPGTITKRPAGVFAGLCQWVKDLIIEPTGDIYPCCGFNRYNKGIVIGNIFKNSLKEVVARAQTDPVLQMIKKYPFSMLHAILCNEGFDLPNEADGPCDICELIFSKEDQVLYLKELYRSGKFKKHMLQDAKCSL